jgi:hypothetical protein
MEKYLRVGAGFLVDRDEWFRGAKATDKVLKAREKEVKLGTAIVVDIEELTARSDDKKKLFRKGKD